MGAGINDVAPQLGSVWLATSGEDVRQLSQADLRQTGVTNLGVIPASVASAKGFVWVGASDPYGPSAALWRLDEQTGRVTQTIVLPGAIGYPPSVQIASGYGSIWAAVWDDGEVFRVNSSDGAIAARIRTGGHPSGIAVGEGKVWVTVS